MSRDNKMVLKVESRSCNEGLARIAVAAFSTQLNPTLEEVADIRSDYKLYCSCISKRNRYDYHRMQQLSKRADGNCKGQRKGD